MLHWLLAGRFAHTIVVELILFRLHEHFPIDHLQKLRLQDDIRNLNGKQRLPYGTLITIYGFGCCLISSQNVMKMGLAHSNGQI